MEKWFLFSTAEGSDTSIKAFKSYKSAYRAMKKDYKNYGFDPTENGYGDSWISHREAYVDSPYDGWQRHWLIISLQELQDM